MVSFRGSEVAEEIPYGFRKAGGDCHAGVRTGSQ